MPGASQFTTGGIGQTVFDTSQFVSPSVIAIVHKSSAMRNADQIILSLDVTQNGGSFQNGALKILAVPSISGVGQGADFGDSKFILLHDGGGSGTLILPNVDWTISVINTANVEYTVTAQIGYK